MNETKFEMRLQNMRHSLDAQPFLEPLVDVMDTADAVRLALEDWGCYDPQLHLGLTRLVFERKDADGR